MRLAILAPLLRKVLYDWSPQVAPGPSWPRAHAVHGAIGGLDDDLRQRTALDGRKRRELPVAGQTGYTPHRFELSVLSRMPRRQRR